MKIVGGQEATQNSWPSIALIVLKYKYSFNHTDGYTYTGTYSSYCGGSLINRNTVLTAAHCYKSSFNVTYLGSTYLITIGPNAYHASFESAFTVYLGLHNKAGVFNSTISLGTGVAYSISRYTKVN